MRWKAPAVGVGVFAIAFIAALIVFAPATLIDTRLAQATHGRLRLVEARGSLWSGTGWIEIRDADGTAGVAKRLAWRVLPLSLLRGHLVAQVELDQATKPFPVTLSLTRIDIANAGINLPAAALGLGMPKLAPFRLTGEVLLNIPHLTLERGRMNGDATLQWRAAGSALTPVSPLGDYEVRFKAAGPVMNAELRTLEGPLQLEGKGTFSNNAAPGFFITARVAAPQQEQLIPLLRLVAVERSAGTFELSSNKPAFGATAH
jgi:general secretion pathway protein N